MSTVMGRLGEIAVHLYLVKYSRCFYVSFTMSKIKITLQPSHLERAHSHLIRLKLKSLDTNKADYLLC